MARIVPPCAVIMLLQMARPSPETFLPRSDVYSGSKSAAAAPVQRQRRCPRSQTQPACPPYGNPIAKRGLFCRRAGCCCRSGCRSSGAYAPCCIESAHRGSCIKSAMQHVHPQARLRIPSGSPRKALPPTSAQARAAAQTHCEVVVKLVYNRLQADCLIMDAVQILLLFSGESSAVKSRSE